MVMAVEPARLKEMWANRHTLDADEACDAAEGYLLATGLDGGGYPSAAEEIRLARAQWLLLWALLRARDEANTTSEAGPR